MTNQYIQPAAEIDWITPLTPASRRHGDIYWSPDTGTDEKQHVFIDGNHLAERFERADGSHFTIAEIGFGFGINFLLTAACWRKRNPKAAMLNYIAFENAPVPRNELAQLFDHLPVGDINERHRERLLARYPLATPGIHTLQIDSDICLLLFVGDVRDAISQVDARVDAWYLDGFSPAKNQDAWDRSIFEQIAAVSQPGATVATYSVAGAVREGLSDAGFQVEKAPGFGRKAEMLKARSGGTWRPRPIARPSVAIVGGGLAGLHCAQALATRGISATVIDQTGPLTGASAIPALAIYPQLAVTPNAGSLFSLAAFDFATVQTAFANTGRSNVAWDEREAGRQARLATLLSADVASIVSPRELSDLSGARIDRPGLHFPGAGWIQPVIDNGIRFEQRQLSDEDLAQLGETFDHVILAPGWNQLAVMSPLGLMPVRGQSIEAGLRSTRLTTVLGGKVAAIPIGEGNRCIAGSTYDQGDENLEERQDDSYQIGKNLGQLLNDDIEIRETYTGIRCATRDRQPIAGALPDWSRLNDAIGQAGVNKRGISLPDDVYRRGAWVLTGLGSHGATTAPLLGEYITRLITGEASCLTRGWASQLDASRFHLRDAGLRRSLSAYRPR